MTLANAGVIITCRHAFQKSVNKKGDADKTIGVTHNLLMYNLLNRKVTQ